MDKKRKTIIKIFKDIGFSIDIQTNLKEVDRKSSQIIKQGSNSISERLSKNSSNQEIFNTAKVEYEDAKEVGL